MWCCGLPGTPIGPRTMHGNMSPARICGIPFVRDSQVAISGYGARSTFVHLYINGYYFGLYNIAETPRRQIHGRVLSVEHARTTIPSNHGGAVDGSSSEWNQLVRSSNLRNLDDSEHYATFVERFDVGRLLRLRFAELVGGDGWTGHGITFMREFAMILTERLAFSPGDCEYAFWTIEGYLGSNPTGWVHPRFASDGGVISKLWRGLEDNDDFLMTFADRVYKHCFQRRSAQRCQQSEEVSTIGCTNRRGHRCGVGALGRFGMGKGE